MKTKTKEVYFCDHCNKLYQRKNACVAHEVKCANNPDNLRACIGCKHLEKKEVDFYYDSFRGEELGKVGVLFCGKVNSFIHPPKVEHSRNGPYEGESLGDGSIENNPMKKECEFMDNTVDYGGLPF